MSNQAWVGLLICEVVEKLTRPALKCSEDEKMKIYGWLHEQTCTEADYIKLYRISYDLH